MGQTPSSGFPIYHMEAHTVIKALEYISQKLCRKGIHVHLIVAGDALSCLLFKSRPTTYVILASFSLLLFCYYCYHYRFISVALAIGINSLSYAVTQ